MRDILVSRRADQGAHDARACALANAHLDGVLVHSDPRFARLEDTFPLHAGLRVPVRHTGFVVPARTAPAAGRGDAVVVSAGGGLVGAPLLRAALGAQRRLWPRTGRPMRLIAGPFLPDDERAALAAEAAGRARRHASSRAWPTSAPSSTAPRPR